MSFDTADRIRHRHSGEEFTVACSHDGYIYTCGTPSRTFHEDYCELVKKASHDDKMDLLQKMASVQSRQHRPVCARERLANMEVVSYDSGCC